MCHTQINLLPMGILVLSTFIKNYGNPLKNIGNSSSILILHMFIFVLCLKVRVKDVERDACYYWQFYADMAI